MWRSSSLQEWERKKSYLIRSLFEDMPILSPILEGYEPTSPSSPSNFIYRAESPLPELIIEVEPKKPNFHDEPEELYHALAKEMRSLYRKDFLDMNLSTSSPESSSSESFNGGRIYDIISNGSDSNKTLDEYLLKNKCQVDYVAIEDHKDHGIDSPTQTEISTSKESSESIPIVSESVIAQIDVHSQEVEEDVAFKQQRFTENKQYRQSEENSINISKTTTIIKSIDGGDEGTDKEERSDSESFAKDPGASSNDSSSESSVNSSHASPEIMRQRQLFASLGTPSHRTISKTNSSGSKTIHFSMEIDSKECSDDGLASNEEIEIDENSGNENLLFVTSTPSRKRTSTRLSMEVGHKKRLVSYSQSSSFPSVANAAFQTSFSDCETDYHSFWSNFFVGIPTVYNVCSCNDHVCTT